MFFPKGKAQFSVQDSCATRLCLTHRVLFPQGPEEAEADGVTKTTDGNTTTHQETKVKTQREIRVFDLAEAVAPFGSQTIHLMALSTARCNLLFTACGQACSKSGPRPTSSYYGRVLPGISQVLRKVTPRPYQAIHTLPCKQQDAFPAFC